MKLTLCCVFLCALTFCCTLPWSDGLEPRLALCFNGHRYAHYQNFVNWTTARDLCQTINFGNLTSIDSQAQQDYFFSNFRGYSVSVWIGLNDIKDEGNFLWVDGSPLNFTNWNGADGTSTSDNEDCVVMRRGLNGTWRDTNCNIAREFLCRETIPAPGEWTECEGREWRMFQENMTWSNAERVCQSYGGHLAYLEVNQSRTTCAKKVLQTCFRTGPQIAVAYVGFRDIFNFTDYPWVRGNSMRNLTLTGSRLCTTFSEDLLIGVSNCSVEYPFICERPLGISSTTYPSSTTDGSSTGVSSGIVLAVVLLVIFSPVMVFIVIVMKLLARKSRNPVPSRQYPLLALEQQEGIHMTSNIAYGVIPPQLSAHSCNDIPMTTRSSYGLTGTHTSSSRDIADRVYSENKDDCDDEYSYIPPTVLDRP